ncbi:unnamed protein product [Protopolystoma xenopodis]|uniref:Uncharacterized protein n=1 Tax=Protopolystoma xenopodis TaxID=117903 RepID=A0A3S5A5D3_9PLAT|nr:unnamed protein product [Protopolystoma xenopodis]
MFLLLIGCNFVSLFPFFPGPVETVRQNWLSTSDEVKRRLQELDAMMQGTKRAQEIARDLERWIDRAESDLDALLALAPGDAGPGSGAKNGLRTERGSAGVTPASRKRQLQVRLKDFNIGSSYFV